MQGRVDEAFYKKMQADFWKILKVPDFEKSTCTLSKNIWQGLMLEFMKSCFLRKHSTKGQWNFLQKDAGRFLKILKAPDFEKSTSTLSKHIWQGLILKFMQKLFFCENIQRRVNETFCKKMQADFWKILKVPYFGKSSSTFSKNISTFVKGTSTFLKIHQRF